MHRILRSAGILLFVMGVGSFILPRYGYDSKVWHALKSSRNYVMSASLVLGVALIVVSYRMQVALEQLEAERRRAARRSQFSSRTRKPEPESGEEEPGDEYAAAGEQPDPEETEAALAEMERANALRARLPENSPAITVATPVPATRSTASLESFSGRTVPTALEASPPLSPIPSGTEIPREVGVHVNVAEEKAGSGSVVIEKPRGAETLRPAEKSGSAILPPKAQSFSARPPAFEEDPESIFDELPQEPGTP